MKILIFGRGVIATQYAWALEKAGNDITFYVRPERLAEYGNKIQLDILDARKKVRGETVMQTWNVKMTADLTENHNYDLIFVSVQHYHFKEVASFLKTRINKATVLLFSNFWEEPLQSTSMLPQEQLVWGFPQAGGGFDKNDVLCGTIRSSITMSDFGKSNPERVNEVVEMFKSIGIKSSFVKDFRSWLYIHFVLNAAIQLEMLKGNAKKMESKKMKSTLFWKNVILNTKELMPLLNARNVDLKASAELKLMSLPAWLVCFAVKISMALLPSVKRVTESHNNINEMKAYCKDVLQSSKELNIDLPKYTQNKSIFQ